MSGLCEADIEIPASLMQAILKRNVLHLEMDLEMSVSK
jgi:hypothetical protein